MMRKFQKGEWIVLAAMCATALAGCARKEDMPILALAKMAEVNPPAAKIPADAVATDTSPGSAVSVVEHIDTPAANRKTETAPPTATDSEPASGSESESRASRKKEAPAESVNINTADEDSLATVPGIGPKMADAIIQYRRENGPFKSTEDLIGNVRGIGEKKFEKMKPFITVGDTETGATTPSLAADTTPAGTVDTASTAAAAGDTATDTP